MIAARLRGFMRPIRLIIAPFGLAFALVTGASSADSVHPAPSSSGVRAGAEPSHASASSELRRLGDAFGDVAEKVAPSVVQVEVTADGDGQSAGWVRSDVVRHGVGSGVVLTADGAIVTNHHVIESARAIQVRLHDGRVLAARLVGRDPATDLAVLRVAATGLTPARFADDGARVGAWVLALGCPFGLGNTLTVGVLSAKGRSGVGMNAVEDYLQTDASINPGNSGGPLVDLDGAVLGISTMIVSKGQGIGLAVPASLVRRVTSQILKHGRVGRAWIGIGVQDLTPQITAEISAAPAAGALVNAVTENGPAAKAHLESGDIVVAMDGKPIRDAEDVLREAFARDPGSDVVFEVQRGGKHYQTHVTLGSRNEPAPTPIPMDRALAPSSSLGLTVRDAPDPEGKGRSVAVVTAVDAGSVADRSGLRAQDVVLEIDGVKWPTAMAIRAAVADGHALVLARRAGATFFAALRN